MVYLQARNVEYLQTISLSDLFCSLCYKTSSHINKHCSASLDSVKNEYIAT